MRKIGYLTIYCLQLFEKIFKYFLFLSLEYFEINEDIETRLDNVKNVFIIVALIFLFCNLIANICFNKSADRQIKRIK